MKKHRKYLLYLIPIASFLLTLYYPGKSLYYDIQLITKGKRVKAICIHHIWKEDSDHEPDIITTNRNEIAYPTVAFEYNDSLYVSNIDPYNRENENGSKSYLITGDSTELIIFPDDPMKRPVVADGNSFIWSPLITLVIFLILSMVLFVWVHREIRNL